MKNKTLLFIIIIFFSAFSNSAFSMNVDSLKIELNKTQEDTAKVSILLKIANGLFDIDITQTRKYAQKANVLSNKLKYKQGIINSLDLIGVTFYQEGNYESAHDNFKKALSVPNNKNLLDFSQLYIDLGIIYEKQTDYIKSIEYYLKAEKIFEKKGNKRGKAIVFSNLGVVYWSQNNIPKALVYLNKSLELSKNIKDARSEINIYTDISGIYMEQENYNKALDISFISLKKCKEISYKYGELCCYGSIGAAYQSLKKYPESIEYFKKSLIIGEELKHQLGTAMTYGNLALTYIKTKQFDKAIECLSKAEVIFKKNGRKDELKYIYLDLSDICEQKKDFKQSLDYFKKYALIKDSIYNIENSQQINEVLTKYETEKKQKEIVLLNADLLKKKKDKIILTSKIQKRNSIIFGTITGSLLLVLTIILLFNRRRLLLKNLHQLEINRQRENTTASIVQAQEKEQSRIAKDLHDSIGTFLSTLKINLQIYEDSIPKNQFEGYQNALNLIDKISVELRNIMKNLSNETLQEQGLIKAFEEIIWRINDLEITQFTFLSNGLFERLDEGIEHNLYRIAQELVNNCIKHAKADKATLQLIVDENSITLMFEDDGIGFDADNPILKHKNHGMGLKNISNRVNFMKGTLRIESNSKNGSLFIIEVPKK